LWNSSSYENAVSNFNFKFRAELAFTLLYELVNTATLRVSSHLKERMRENERMYHNMFWRENSLLIDFIHFFICFSVWELEKKEELDSLLESKRVWETHTLNKRALRHYPLTEIHTLLLIITSKCCFGICCMFIFNLFCLFFHF
jgi:hypothetical protein